MGLGDKLKANSKNMEGKLEAAAGDLTGNQEMKAKGEAKQVQGSAMNAMNDLKDKATDALDGIKKAID